MRRASVQRTFLKAWLWLSAAIVLVVYANNSTAITTAQPLLQGDSSRQADPSPPTVLSGTLNHFVHLPLVRLSPPAPPAVYWGAMVDGQAPSTGNMQPGGVFDVFETEADVHGSKHAPRSDLVV